MIHYLLMPFSRVLARLPFLIINYAIWCFVIARHCGPSRDDKQVKWLLWLVWQTLGASSVLHTGDRTILR